MRLRISGKTYDRLNEMVDRAIDGTFCESDYDETELSKLESKWMRYLSSAALSSQKVQKERATLKALISDISHQTRIPISNLKLYSELLKEQELNEESGLLAEKIHQQSIRLEFLIQSLVKMSRMEAGTIQVKASPHPVKELLYELVQLGEAKAKAKGSQIVLGSCSDCDACYDGKWTTEAICNIVDNAIKYSPSGSKICLAVEPYEMFVRISVTDSGIGISESEQAQIFNRFYRSPRVQQEDGVGLGLYLAREIIIMGQGFIRLKSREGQGSIFYIYLPRETF